MKVRSSSELATGVLGAISLAIALVVAGGSIASAAASPTDEVGLLSSAAGADAEAVLDEKIDSVETAGPSPAPALTAIVFKSPTPIAPVVKPKEPRSSRAVAKASAKSSTGGWRIARVSWYGPGFYGHTMAGGGKLTPSSMVVAHRALPFGTKVEIEYKGRRVVAVVMDRGPYVRGRTFDLGPGTAKALGFSGVGTIRWRIVK